LAIGIESQKKKENSKKKETKKKGNEMKSFFVCACLAMFPLGIIFSMVLGVKHSEQILTLQNENTVLKEDVSYLLDQFKKQNHDIITIVDDKYRPVKEMVRKQLIENDCFCN